MTKEAGFNESELKVFSFLADDEGHALWKMHKELGIDEGYLAKILKGLKAKGLIYKKERSLVRPGKRGPQTEYPWHIHKDKLSNITEKVLFQIRHYMAKGIAASNEIDILKVNGVLTPSLKDKLTSELLFYWGKADETMELFKIPLYRDSAAEILHLDCISYEGICGLMYNQFGILPFTLRSSVDEAKHREEQKIMTPQYFFEKYKSNLENAITNESGRRTLEANTVAIQKIKELWNKGCRNGREIAGAIGQPSDVVNAEIEKMLDCREIVFTSSEFNRQK
jgi:predicted transcriptional regulator